MDNSTNVFTGHSLQSSESLGEKEEWSDIVSLGQTSSSSTTLTPIASAASIPAGTVTVNAAQLSSMPGLQTINLSALGAPGIQVHQLPSLPLAIANASGKT